MHRIVCVYTQLYTVELWSLYIYVYVYVYICIRVCICIYVYISQSHGEKRLGGNCPKSSQSFLGA